MASEKRGSDETRSGKRLGAKSGQLFGLLFQRVLSGRLGVSTKAKNDSFQTTVNGE